MPGDVELPIVLSASLVGLLIVIAAAMVLPRRIRMERRARALLRYAVAISRLAGNWRRGPESNRGFWPIPRVSN
jgi:hypothetical protein